MNEKRVGIRRVPDVSDTGVVRVVDVGIHRSFKVLDKGVSAVLCIYGTPSRIREEGNVGSNKDILTDGHGIVDTLP